MTKNEKRLNDQIMDLVKLCKEKDAEIATLKENERIRMRDKNHCLGFTAREIHLSSELDKANSHAKLLVDTLNSFNKFIAAIKKINP